MNISAEKWHTKRLDIMGRDLEKPVVYCAVNGIILWFVMRWIAIYLVGYDMIEMELFVIRYNRQCTQVYLVRGTRADRYRLFPPELWKRSQTPLYNSFSFFSALLFYLDAWLRRGHKCHHGFINVSLRGYPFYDIYYGRYSCRNWLYQANHLQSVCQWSDDMTLCSYVTNLSFNTHQRTASYSPRLYSHTDISQ